MKALKVIIPLKTNSERLVNKNLREFFKGQSLFDIKAKQLLQFFNPIDIYVSSENPNIENCVKQYGFNFHLRDINLTKSITKETDIVFNLVNAIPGKPDILWCQVTQPLFSEFDKLLDIYYALDTKYDSIAVVKRISHHILDERGNPVNFNFGYWHKISQDLPRLFEVTWAAFIMKRKMLEQAWYQIGRTPFLYESSAPLVDINNLQEFELARILYKYYYLKSQKY